MSVYLEINSIDLEGICSQVSVYRNAALSYNRFNIMAMQELSSQGQTILQNNSRHAE